MKNMSMIKNITALIILVALFTFPSCNEDDGTSSSGKGQFQAEITDAPIDDSNVQGAFVTVASVKIDGETWSGFSGKTTIDLLAYQNGSTAVLGSGELDAKAYSNVSLVLDLESDANGNSPGCYVLTADNTKHALASSGSSTQEIALSSTFEVKENAQSKLVFDFDVRKAIKAEGNDSSSDQYNFVTNTELNAAIRVVNKDETGEVEGNCQDSPVFGSDKIIVYAYKLGTWNENTEMQGQGSSSIEFKNATSSAIVNANGEYTLAFLQEGEYELYFVGYNESTTDNDGYEINGLLELNGLLNFGGVTIGAGAKVTFDVSITGIL